ncbi:MAG: LamG-like jellyroll fold domain-containing protein, partial [Candidatus Peribacter sp.]|nr:LamG-like jellyroll fold domain-containing protein [Candidatus Peribacter sp.]
MCLLVLLFLQPGMVSAATRTWDGGGSTNNWSEDANWSDNTEPTAADTALFDATDATDATVDTNILIGGLTVTSGYGGTLNFGSATITGSVGDGAVQFTAADKSWLQIADASQTGLDPGTSDFSISGWVYLDSLGAHRTIFAKGAQGIGSDFLWIFVDATNKIRVQLNDSSGSYFDATNTGQTAFSASTWYHVVVNFDRDGNVTAYINGTAYDLGSISDKATSIDNSSPAYIGIYNGSLYYFNGKLDSLSFSSRVLTTNEITWLYNSGNGRVYKDIGIAGTNGSALKTSLVSWWDLGENAGTRYDSYGTNHLSQAFASIIAPPVYGSELLTNGGFETVTSAGPPANFGTWNEGTGDGNIEVETAVIHDGSNAVKLTMGASFNTNINQNYSSIIAGATYRLSFWSAGDGTNAGLVRVYDISNTVLIRDYTTTGITAGTYGLVTYDFVAPTGCTNVGFYFRPASVNGGIAYFDDVSLKQITTASLNNGGFEDWTTSTNAGTWVESVAGTSTVNREDTAPYHGTNAARLDVDASNSSASVYLTPSTANKLYSYTIYARALSGTPTFKVTDNSVVTNSHTLTTSYAAYSSSIRPTNTRFEIARNSAASNSIYIDSVTLTAAEILGTTGIPRGQAPAVDYAGQFNGTSQYLNATTVALSPGTGDFAVGMSFYLDKLPATGTFFVLLNSGENNSANDYYYVYINPSGTIQVRLNDTITLFNAASALSLSPGNWYTLVINYDRDGNATSYVNNSSTGWVNSSVAATSGSVDTGVFTIGKVGLASYFPGRINGAFYANRVLTTNEITYLHNNGKWRM